MSSTPAESMYSAFISYASADREKADAICASLEERGLRCWIAPRDVRAGREYGEEIIHGIEQSRCLVLVLSEAANQSTFVRREVERAVSKKKPVFPIRVEEVLPSPSLELFVASTHWIDAWTGDLVQHVDRLARDLTDESKVASAAAASSRIVRRRSLPRWLAGAGAFAAIVAAIVLGNILSRPSTGDGSRSNGDGDAQEAQQPGTAQPFSNPGDWEATASATHRQMVEATGVDPASITQSDITITPEIGAARGDIGIRVDLSSNMQRLATIADLHAAVGEGGFQRIGSASRARISSHTLDQDALKESKSLRLRFDLKDGRTIGPFTYVVDPELARRSQLERNLAGLEKWLDTYGTSVAYIAPLYQYVDSIEAIHLGTSPETLDRRIEILAKDEDPARIDAHFVRDERPSNFRPFPLDPEANEVYVQLEFTDGSRSDVRRVSLALPEFPSKRLAVVESPEGTIAPAVYALFEHGQLKFLPMAPPGATRIQYSLDHGPLLQFDLDLYASQWAVPLSGRAAGGTTWEKPLAGKSTIQFLFQMLDGGELGPFSYSLEGIYELAIPPYKQEILTTRREIVAAVRLPADERHGFAIRGAFSHIARGEGDDSTNLDVDPLLNDLPAVILYSRRRTPNQMPLYDTTWVAVERVLYGTSRDALSESVTIALTPERLITEEPPDRNRGFWAARLPADTQEVWCKFIFRDGEESEPFRVPVEDWPE